MSKVTVEPRLFADPRFARLVRRVKSKREAIGTLVEFWQLAIHYWGKDRSLVPLQEFEDGDFGDLLIVGFAEMRPEGIYAAGSEKNFDWYHRLCSQAKSAGQKSASVRREKFGTAIPEGATNRTSGFEKTEPGGSENPNPPIPTPIQSQDNLTTASNGHSPQPQQPPIGSPSATSPLKRIGFKATKAAARVISTMQLVGNREQEAYRAIGEEAYAALLTKYPLNTWGQVCASYWDMAQHGKASFFEADLRRLFEAHFAEGEGCITSQASLPVAPGSIGVD